MYVVVQHTISEPAVFWNTADPNSLPPGLRLHHIFPTADGTRAVCLWEGKSPEAVRDFLEPLLGRVSRNEYFAVENREGFARPSQLAQTAAAGSR
jgi:hypothetical protein